MGDANSMHIILNAKVHPMDVIGEDYDPDYITELMFRHGAEIEESDRYDGSNLLAGDEAFTYRRVPHDLLDRAMSQLNPGLVLLTLRHMEWGDGDFARVDGGPIDWVRVTSEGYVAAHWYDLPVGFCCTTPTMLYFVMFSSGAKGGIVARIPDGVIQLRNPRMHWAAYWEGVIVDEYNLDANKEVMWLDAGYDGIVPGPVVWET